MCSCITAIVCCNCRLLLKRKKPMRIGSVEFYSCVAYEKHLIRASVQRALLLSFCTGNKLFVFDAVTDNDSDNDNDGDNEHVYKM